LLQGEGREENYHKLVGENVKLADLNCEIIESRALVCVIRGEKEENYLKKRGILFLTRGQEEGPIKRRGAKKKEACKENPLRSLIQQFQGGKRHAGKKKKERRYLWEEVDLLEKRREGGEMRLPSLRGEEPASWLLDQEAQLKRKKNGWI